MKRLSIQVFLIFVLSNVYRPCFGQTDSATKAKLDEVLKRVKDLEEDEIQHIGSVSYIANKYYDVYEVFPIYGKKRHIRRNPIEKNVVKKVILDSIIMITRDGFVVDFTAYSSDGLYTNKKAPIALTKFRMTKIDNLFSVKGNKKQCIVFQEVIDLDLDNSYIPEDSKIVLKRGKNTSILKCNVSLNTVLDARVYSDALGLIGGQSNGLAQTDLRFKQVLHRKNLGNQGNFIFQYFKINLNISKFDSKDKYTDSLNFSRSKLFQRSYANAEMAMNILNGSYAERKSTNTYYIDGGGGVHLSRLSKKNDTITSEIVIPSWFVECGLNIKVSDNIGANGYIRYIRQHLPKNDFTTEPANIEFWKFGAEIYYNPVEKRASRVFARINYNLIGNTKDEKNSYFQFQLGYSVLLTKLINK